MNKDEVKRIAIQRAVDGMVLIRPDLDTPQNRALAALVAREAAEHAISGMEQVHAQEKSEAKLKSTDNPALDTNILGAVEVLTNLSEVFKLASKNKKRYTK
jgi:hypothetical protein